ncbi:CAP domain-containing protein [Pigmentiphaga sp. H8]|uniref:CAP domain-containing protein n=1 Tax=Pigmentiphaga sp. H8 TaxID=2488560 RepID=UPI0013761C7A|nr:CAP domain-containing protein [Pigmentiphaga sp. H8]
MPTSSHTGDKLAAFTRLNEARLAAGVSAVKQNAQLDAAAQAHATYQVRNYVVGHGEDPNKPGFTGTGPIERAIAQGYVGNTVGEVISYTQPGIEAIESLLLSVYHLHALLDPRANQVGIGVDTTTTPAHLSSTSITLGSSSSGLLTTALTWHWPAAEQTNINPSFVPSNESPNPAPDLSLAGTPIMFCGAVGHFAPLHVSLVSLQEEGTSVSVPLRLLKNEVVQVDKDIEADVVVDPQLTPASVYQGCIFLLPVEALQPGKNYLVQIEATQAGESLSNAWSFTTRNSN